MPPATQQRQALLLRIAGTIDFLIAVVFLLGPRLGISLEPAVRNAAAGFLLMGSVVMFMLARRADRLAVQSTQL